MLDFSSGTSAKKKFLIIMAGSASAQVVGLLAMPILTRIYTPAEFGMWAVYFGVVTTIGSVAGLRFDLAIFAERRIAFRTQLLAASLRSCLVVAVASGLGWGLIGWVSSSPIVPTWCAPLVFLNVLSLGYFQSFQYWKTQSEDFAPVARIRLGQALVTMVIQLSLGLMGVGISGLLLGTMIGQGLPLLHTVPRFVRFLEPRLRRPIRESFARHWRMPVFNGGTALIDGFRLNGLNAAIAAIFSAGSLGQYSLAWRMVLSPTTMVSQAMTQLYLPRLSAHAGVRRRAEAIRCFRNSVLMAILPFSILAFTGGDLFAVLFGSDWRTAGEVAARLSPYLAMVFVTAPLSSIFVIVNRQWISLVFAVAYAVVPLVSLWLERGDFLMAVELMGWAMAVVLCLYAVVAIAISKAE